MKKLISFLIVLFALTGTIQAQNVKVDANGNYTAIKPAKNQDSSKPTGKTFTDSKGTVYPVYVSSNDKLYVLRISKAGNTYKQYLKL